MAGGRAALNLILAVVLGVMIGGLLATPTDDTNADATSTTTVAQVTPEEVARLADALEALTTTTVPPAAEPLVAEAEDVLDEVREQTPPRATPPPPTSSTSAPTTTTAPATTTTQRVRDLVPTTDSP